MDRKTYSNALYGQFARIGKAVASPRRLFLLELLSQGPRTVEALAEQADMSVANTSQHLQVLRRARMVGAERDGLFVVYSMAGEDVRAFLARLRGLAESRLAEVEHVRREYLEKREAMEPVDAALLIERVRDGEVTLLDVRPSEEYRAGHLSGAISVPLPDLKRRLDSLPRERDVVAYCRGPYCVLAVEAAEILRQHGFTAFRLDDGVAEWRERGFAVATGEEGESSGRDERPRDRSYRRKRS